MIYRNFYTCAFFGHGSIFNQTLLREKLKRAIENMIINGAVSFLIGTHGDFDKLALSVCRELRNKYKDIQITIVLTSINSLNKKYGYSKADYYDDVQTIFYPIEEVYFKQRITISNRYMVDSCDYVICYVDMNKTHSGAKAAVKYAQKKNKEIINLFV